MQVDELININYPQLFGDGYVIDYSILQGDCNSSKKVIEILHGIDLVMKNTEDLPILNKDGYQEDDLYGICHTIYPNNIPYVSITGGSGAIFIDIYRKDVLYGEIWNEYRLIEVIKTEEIKKSLEIWRDFLIEHGH